MTKKSKLKTPDWVLKGEKKPKEKKKGKVFKVRLCPSCNSDDVGVVIGGQIGMWECHKCKHRGSIFPETEMTEDEFMKFLDDKGEEVA